MRKMRNFAAYENFPLYGTCSPRVENCWPHALLLLSLSLLWDQSDTVSSLTIQHYISLLPRLFIGQTDLVTSKLYLGTSQRLLWHPYKLWTSLTATPILNHQCRCSSHMLASNRLHVRSSCFGISYSACSVMQLNVCMWKFGLQRSGQTKIWSAWPLGKAMHEAIHYCCLAIYCTL